LHNKGFDVRQGPEAPPPEALAVLDDVACGLMQTAEDGTILRVNRTFSDWVGQPASALLHRQRFQDLLTMGGRIFHQTHWAPLLRMQGSISEVKLELSQGDRPGIPIVINAIRHERSGFAWHEIAAFVARDRDKYERELVLSRKRLEELVAEATRLQEEAKDRALFAEQMIGIVSHDLRNPLSGITMGAALLTRAQLPEGQQRTLSRMLRSADRAHALIADLLDFTQARVGKGLSVSLESMDLHRTVSDAIDELALIHHGKATLQHRRSGEGACTADRNRLVQLVGNLVSNAVAYGAPGQPVTVTSGVGSTCFVAVHNHGTAIPQERQDLIFKPMTRGTEGGAGRSVGLGLFIVREIAKAHRGEARVTSTPADGTTFIVSFPQR
jgi:sigma-B regulation protein RsbU (phosphoserine phosphatase)